MAGLRPRPCAPLDLESLGLSRISPVSPRRRLHAPIGPTCPEHERPPRGSVYPVMGLASYEPPPVAVRLPALERDTGYAVPALLIRSES